MPKKKKNLRADGRYMLRRKMPDGSSKCFYGKTVTEAESKYKAAYDAAVLAAEKQNGGATFREMATAYEDYITGPGHPVKRGTITAYRKHLPPMLEYFGDIRMADIDVQAVHGYMQKMKTEGKALHTITNAKSVLSCVFSYWCANYHGNANPVLLTKLPAGLREGKRGEPTEEQRDLINAHPEGCGFWAWLFEYTGLRMGEANGLQWKDIDLDAGTITPVQAMPWDRNQPYKEQLKTKNAYRTIPILSPLRPLLERERVGHSPEDYVLSGTAKPLTQTQYERRWTMYCRELGLCSSYTREVKIPAWGHRTARTVTRTEYRALVTAHQFRHLFATNLFYAGIPDMVAQQLLGHADIMTTRRIYQHLRGDESQKYTKMLDDYVSGKT